MRGFDLDDGREDAGANRVRLVRKIAAADVDEDVEPSGGPRSGSSASRNTTREVSRPKYSSSERSLMAILPEPGCNQTPRNGVLAATSGVSGFGNVGHRAPRFFTRLRFRGLAVAVAVLLMESMALGCRAACGRSGRLHRPSASCRSGGRAGQR